MLSRLPDPRNEPSLCAWLQMQVWYLKDSTKKKTVMCLRAEGIVAILAQFETSPPESSPM